MIQVGYSQLFIYQTVFHVPFEEDVCDNFLFIPIYSLLFWRIFVKNK